MTESPAPALSPIQFAVLNAVVTTLALGFLVWLVYFHEGPSEQTGTTQLPAFNALFNGIAASLLIAGRVVIRRGQRKLHQHLMISALVASTLFLINYVNYHYSYGDTLFQGSGWIRPVYFTVLISHIALSTVVFPAILTSLYLGLSDRIERHRVVAKWTWAGWMYVSVTGIVIYLMLHVVSWA
jgi:putative membrane protein